MIFLRGLNDDGYVDIIEVINNNQPHYLCSGNCDVFENIEHESLDKLCSKQLITLDTNQLQDINYADSKLVFNQIANPDTHTITLIKAKKFIDAINHNPSSKKIDCINQPQAVLQISKEHLHEKLSSINSISMPESVRIKPLSATQIGNKINELAWIYPIIISPINAKRHSPSIKINNPGEIEKLPYYYFENECYLSPFIDYADNKGIFRKFRIAVIDGEFILRHVLYNNHWRVSSEARKFMKTQSWHFSYEKNLIESFDAEIKPHIADSIKSIHEITGLDFYGIDFSLDENMNLLIFNLSPDMHLLSHHSVVPNIWTIQISQIKNHLIDLIKQRLTNT